MDLVWIACTAVLWGLMVALVKGVQRLEPAQRSKA
jgi:hypothetical protein